MLTETQRVARAIDRVHVFMRYNDWTRDHVPGKPIEICLGLRNDGMRVIARYAGSCEEDGAVHLHRHKAEERAKAAIKALRR